MIKYNNNTIYDWNFDTSNVIKVYRNNAIVFYKFSGESPTPEWKVCFAVVDDISQYQETEFEDVYDNATEKWYKLNNLNQYEVYGVYASGRTSCEGSASRLPQGYTEVEYIENTTMAYLDIDFKPDQDTRIVIDTQIVTSTNYGKIISSGQWDKLNGIQLQYEVGVNGTLLIDWGTSTRHYNTNINGDYNRHIYDWNKNNFYLDETLVASTTYGNFQSSCNLLVFMASSTSCSPSLSSHERELAKLYSLKIYDNDVLSVDLVPCINSNNVAGVYDIVNDVFYTSPNGNNFIGGPTDCVTTYEGKLTIDDGYEYEWNGSSWVNLGEVTRSRRVPQGYTEVEYIQNTSTAYINTNFKPNQDTRIVTEMQTVTSTNYGRFLGAGSYDKINGIQFDYETGANGTLHVSWGTVAGWTTYSSCVGDYNKHTYDWNKNEFYRDNTLIGSVTYGNFQCTDYLAILGNIFNGTAENFLYGKMYTFQLYDNGTLIRDLVPCKRDSDDKYGAYDIVNNVFYTSPNGVNFIGGSETGSTEYPKYYSEKSDPLNDLTFNTMDEAQTYAYNNCVYDGMRATIDGNRYYFDSSDENGWIKILEYYKVEDVTPSGGSGWTISGSSIYNPDSSYYDDFDLQTSSTSNVTKIAKVTIYGYDHFTYYLRSYHGYSSYVYLVATNVDEISTPPSTMGYNSSSAITNTYYWNKSPKSAVNLSNYRRITYNNLDKTVEHTFYVYFYGRTYRSYVGNATILIPKDQSQENWEQVTFSASSNVASIQKNLYIDGNYSASGGTNIWHSRWIVGLPSGSHSSSTNYSSYDYCPNVTSSTFTSVAGEQRQVNFTYDGTTSKSLSFRLVDGSGNVLTPSDTVYYNMTLVNPCNVTSSSSNLTFPRSQYVKVGGSFYFTNSSNRHYIYGYQAPALGTTYYTDDYQDTFDIVYTKLNDEAVTITYTTYDPNDSETPAFKTDITYPYNGGSTSSTTLTSYDVPYTYPYTVKQTNTNFSADSQEYTANQAARTISFTLYPNNREFATVADMEAYAYAWEGMNANVSDTKYKYENGEWVENQHSLPDVPFVLNYNAKQYNASTHTIPYTEGALNAINAVITGRTANIIDHHENGYIQLTGSTSTAIRALVGTTNFSRSSSNPNITIICKAYTPGSSYEGNILSNRNQSHNWMYRHKSTQLRFHGTSEQGSIAVSNTEPNTCSVRIDSSRLLKYNNWTQNTTSSYSNFNYGSDSNGGALFSGYYSSNEEYWKGVFYWIYMSLNTLTDEQVQQVIDYNENL